MSVISVSLGFSTWRVGIVAPRFRVAWRLRLRELETRLQCRDHRAPGQAGGGPVIMVTVTAGEQILPGICKAGACLIIPDSKMGAPLSLPGRRCQVLF